MLTQHQLKEVLEYEPETGVFLWIKVRYNHIKLLGTEAGIIYSNGYHYIDIDGRSYRSGRLAWLYVHGEWPPGHIDHKDLNKANNRIDNLRICNDSQNGANKGLFKNNTSGTKGVRYEASRGKWRAQITVNGRSKNLGRYPTREEAMSAYERAAVAAWGEFART